MFPVAEFRADEHIGSPPPAMAAAGHRVSVQVWAEHARSVAPLHTLAAEARQLEMQVSDLVNAAYGLTPDEVTLMWQTAPPRMPVGPPAGR